MKKSSSAGVVALAETHKVRRNDVLANYAYDLTGNLALAFGCFATTASLFQMFQIGGMRRQITSLEGRLSSLEGEPDENAGEATPPAP